MIEDDLLHGITVTLNSEFGSGVPIYTEAVNQGLREPCFFVLCLGEEEARQLGTRAKRMLHFDITYLANSTKSELRACAAKLYPLMRQVKLLDGTLVNGFDLHYEIADDALHFFVTFKPFVQYGDTEPVVMQEVLENDVGLSDVQK